MKIQTQKQKVMHLIRKNDPFLSLMEDFMHNDWQGGKAYKNFNRTSPLVNIVEEGDRFLVEMAAPGLTKEDFKIDLDHRVLTISNETKVNEQDQKVKYSRREFNFNSFKRAFNLPDTVDTDSIKAEYEQGILQVILPKREEAKQKPIRSIAIQ